MLLNVLAQICLSRTHNKSERYIVSIVAVRNGFNGIKVVRWSSTFIAVEECRKCTKLVESLWGGRKTWAPYPGNSSGVDRGKGLRKIHTKAPNSGWITHRPYCTHSPDLGSGPNTSVPLII